MDLEWYTEVGTDKPNHSRKALKQLQNFKGKKFKKPKLQMMKIWVATWVMGKLF